MWRSFAERSRQHLAGDTAPQVSGDSLWEEEPVDIQTFCTEFLHEPLFPAQLKLAEALVGKDPHAWDVTYTEALAFWGMGSGKDRTAAKIMTYLVYKLLCLKSPQRFLDLEARDKIDLINVGPTAYQAEVVFFRELKLLVIHTKNPKTGRNWFAERGLNLKRDIKVREITFPKQITAYSRNGEEFTAVGFSILLAIMDEVGAFDPRKAKDLYDSLRMTARSRFPLYLKLLLLSTKYADNDYMVQRVQEAQREPSTYVDGPRASWDVNPKLKKEQYQDEYVRDPEKAQRKYECAGTSRENRFFTYREPLIHAFSTGRIEHPIVGNPASVTALKSLAFKPGFQPTASSYFLHVDLAKGQQDAAGLALGHFDKGLVAALPEAHLVELAQAMGTPVEALRQQLNQKPGGVVIDLALQFKAPPGREILFDEVVQFIVRLSKETWKLGRVTFDAWQSASLIQTLQRAGINAQELSVTKDPKAYNTLKALLYEGALACHPQPILLRELEELIVTPEGKIDHPPTSYRRSREDGSTKGSKDLADAVAGCVYLCTKFGKSNFQFWPAGGEDPIKDRPDLQRKLRDAYRYESEELVRRGEKPASWYKRFPW